MSEREMVDHPAHYRTKGGWEVIDVIEAWDLDFCLGNAVKYLLRHRKKDNPAQDLLKSEWYVGRAANGKFPPRTSVCAWRPSPEEIATAFGLNKSMSQTLGWIYHAATATDLKMKADCLSAASDTLQLEANSLKLVDA
jgi:hypothetical protein